MYVLLYFNKDYDASEAFVIAVSHDYDKLSAKLNDLITQTELAKAHNAKISNRVQQEFAKFIIENAEFWERNRHAIMNPYRKDGLFVKELSNSHPFSVPVPSGCLLLNNQSYICPDNITVKLTDTEIDNIVDNVIHNLARTTDYSYYKYINWDKISEPIPVFSYNYLYDEYKSIKIDYRTDNLSIDDVEFIE